MENWHGFGFLKISDYDNENSLLLYFHYFADVDIIQNEKTVCKKFKIS
jgi:hypothetical protein